MYVERVNSAAMMTQIELDKPGGPEQLTVRQEPIPVPGPAQVLVRVEAAGVAFNDITTRQGRSPGRLPRVLGFDLVGEIVAAGGQVSSVKVGQRVAALVGTGGYASHIVLDAADLVAVRSDVDPALLDALVLNYVTAWQMLHHVAQVQPGGSILVLGAAGGVGSALLEIARLDDITVYGTSSAPRRAVRRGQRPDHPHGRQRRPGTRSGARPGASRPHPVCGLPHRAAPGLPRRPAVRRTHLPPAQRTSERPKYRRGPCLLRPPRRPGHRLRPLAGPPRMVRRTLDIRMDQTSTRRKRRLPPQHQRNECRH